MRNERSPIRALIFDVDGTLAETEAHGHRIAFNRAFAVWKLPVVWGVREYGELLDVTGGKERIRSYWHSHPELRALNDDEIAALHQLKTQFFLELLNQGKIPLRPGVELLLRDARDRGVRLGIATTTTRANIIALFTATMGTDALNWFEAIVAGDEVARKKPAPDVYQKVLHLLGLDPVQCVAVEDSEPGFRAAQAAGIPTLVAINQYTYHGSYPRAVCVIDGFQSTNIVQGLNLQPIPQLQVEHIEQWYAQAVHS